MNQVKGDETQPQAPASSSLGPLDNNIHGHAMDSLYEVTRLPALKNSILPNPSRRTQSDDLISRGVIPEAVAQQLFDRFVNRLDHYCYGIMCPHADLSALRSSSPLLTTAIRAVSALHDPGGSDVFKVCHAEFLGLVSASMFSLAFSTDDIRALIVGSYWLTPISYTLVGHAIRVATRLNYHVAYFAAIRGSQADVEKGRLWYVFYVLDHHSSILYGRPAIISAAAEPSQQWETFVASNGNSAIDLRITSQVALHHVTAKAKDMLGSSADQAVPEHFLGQLRGYFSELDRWYLVWGNRMGR